MVLFTLTYSNCVCILVVVALKVFFFYFSEDKYIALESVFYRGQYVGVQEDGNLLPPGETPFRDRASLFISFPHSPITGVSNSIGKYIQSG